MEKTIQDKETKEKNLYSDLQRRMLGKDVKQRMENKMQDSQKAKDELWNRLWKEFGQLVYMEGMNEHVKEGANGDLVDFIASEISKAREEGYKKGRDKIDKSTPEEWEEGFNRYWGCMFECGDYEKLIGDIKQLLLERERWAIHTFLKDTASYNSFHNGRPRTMRNGLSGEGFEVRVSKLTTK